MPEYLFELRARFETRQGIDVLLGAACDFVGLFIFFRYARFRRLTRQHEIEQIVIAGFLFRHLDRIRQVVEGFGNDGGQLVAFDFAVRRHIAERELTESIHRSHCRAGIKLPPL